MTSHRSFPLSVIIADPHDIGRAGLRALLADDPRFTVVGETADEVLPLAERLQPDVVVLDPRVDDGLDIPLIADLTEAAPEACICVRTTVVAPQSALQALQAGALAYLVKVDAPSPFLQDALALVGRFGAAVTGPTAVRHFREQLAGRLTLAIAEPDTMRLTDREREVLALMVQGTMYKEIAGRLRIERSTVAVHVQHMLAKIGTKNRDQLCYLAGHRGLV